MLTPYNPEAWECLLISSGLISRYAHIPESLCTSFTACTPLISSTYTPPNHPSILEHRDAFKSSVTKEFTLSRYLGPYSQSEIKSVFGRFQTSPLSIIPKPGRPGKFRIIQNLSFPHSSEPVPSINSRISSDLFPCTYGTFTIVSHLISCLPPGSQAAIWDVSEAYRTVPLHPAEWPSLVIRVSPEWFAVDTCLCFGFGPSGSIYGALAGAGTQLLHAKGISPIS